MFPILILSALALIGAGSAVVYSLSRFSAADPGSDLTGFLTEADVQEIMQELHYEDCTPEKNEDSTAESKRKPIAPIFSPTTHWTNVPVWRTAHPVPARSDAPVYCYIAEPGSHELILQSGEKPILNGQELCINCDCFTETNDAEYALKQFFVQASRSEEVMQQISEQLE